MLLGLLFILFSVCLDILKKISLGSTYHILFVNLCVQNRYLIMMMHGVISSTRLLYYCCLYANCQ